MDFSAAQNMCMSFSTKSTLYSILYCKKKLTMPITRAKRPWYYSWKLSVDLLKITIEKEWIPCESRDITKSWGYSKHGFKCNRLIAKLVQWHLMPFLHWCVDKYLSSRFRWEWVNEVAHPQFPNAFAMNEDRTYVDDSQTMAYEFAVSYPVHLLSYYSHSRDRSGASIASSYKQNWKKF